MYDIINSTNIMKITGKNKRVHEIAEALKAEGKEITVSSLASWAMGQVTQRTYLKERYQNLVQGDFNKYMREIHANIAKETPDNPTN